MTLAALAASLGAGTTGKGLLWALEDPGRRKIKQDDGRRKSRTLKGLAVRVDWAHGWTLCRNARSNTRCRSPGASFNTILSTSCFTVSHTVFRGTPYHRAPRRPFALKVALQRTVPSVRLRDTEIVPSRVGCEPVAASATHHLIVPDESDGQRTSGPKRRLIQKNPT